MGADAEATAVTPIPRPLIGLAMRKCGSRSMVHFFKLLAALPGMWSDRGLPHQFSGGDFWPLNAEWALDVDDRCALDVRRHERDDAPHPRSGVGGAAVTSAAAPRAERDAYEPGALHGATWRDVQLFTHLREPIARLTSDYWFSGPGKKFGVSNETLWRTWIYDDACRQGTPTPFDRKCGGKTYAENCASPRAPCRRALPSSLRALAARSSIVVLHATELPPSCPHPLSRHRRSCAHVRRPRADYVRKLALASDCGSADCAHACPFCDYNCQSARSVYAAPLERASLERARTVLSRAVVAITELLGEPRTARWLAWALGAGGERHVPFPHEHHTPKCEVGAADQRDGAAACVASPPPEVRLLREGAARVRVERTPSPRCDDHKGIATAAPDSAAASIGTCRAARAERARHRAIRMGPQSDARCDRPMGGGPRRRPVSGARRRLPRDGGRSQWRALRPASIAGRRSRGKVCVKLPKSRSTVVVLCARRPGAMEADAWGVSVSRES